jgi:hypothetical protein
VERTKLVQRWQPGDRTGSLFYVSSQWRDQRLSEFCSAAEISSVIREFVYPIPEEERQEVLASVAISVYAKHGGHKRVVLGTWNPAGSTPLERFVRDCKSEALGYKVVYPPNESVEIGEPED